MHARFNLNLGCQDFSEYVFYGKKIHTENKVLVEASLDQFKNADGILQAERIINRWFPKIQADVFLSHSHKDEDLVIGLAGWLKKEFGINSFIDSTVWGYSDRLLKEIDDEYCKSETSGTYSYELRNRSTSHVHMMLSTALADMIDRCECVIFVNTPQSFRPVDYLKSEGRTESPWIYSEIAMTRTLRQKSPQEHRSKLVFESADDLIKRAEVLRVEYPLGMFHLTSLSMGDLNKWLENHSKKPAAAHWGCYPLDALYDIMKRR